MAAQKQKRAAVISHHAPHVLIFSFQKAPPGRFELPTFRLTAERSAIELRGNSLPRCIPGNDG